MLADKLIAVAWRSPRLLRYETAAIRSLSDTAIDDWERLQAEYDISGDWQSTKDLAWNAKRLKKVLKALDEKNPIKNCPEIWKLVFLVGSVVFDVDNSDLLSLKEQDEDYTYSENEIQMVVDAACEDAEISEDEFWREANNMCPRLRQYAC